MNQKSETWKFWNSEIEKTKNNGKSCSNCYNRCYSQRNENILYVALN